MVRYFICFLSNKTLALSLLLEQRQGLLLIHSKRTVVGGGRILLFNAIMIYEPSSLFIFLFLCIHWSRNNEQMAEWLPPSSPPPPPPRGAIVSLPTRRAIVLYRYNIPQYVIYSSRSKSRWLCYVVALCSQDNCL